MTKKQRIIDPVDLQVGKLIKHRRGETGLSQEDVGQFLGVSAQQVQKNEKGITRVSASRLAALARLFGVPISYFFRQEEIMKTINKKYAAALANASPVDIVTIEHFVTASDEMKKQISILVHAMLRKECCCRL